MEEETREYNILKKEFELAELDEKNKHEQFSRTKTEIEQIEKRIGELKKEIEGKEVIGKEEINKKIESKEKEILELENELKNTNGALNEFRIRKKHAEEVKLKILKISKCPTCEQDVEKEHKDNIIRRENYSIEECDKGIEENSEKEKKIEGKLSKSRQELQELRKVSSEISIIEIRKKEIDERAKAKQELLVRQDELKKGIGMIYAKKNRLNQKLEELKDIEERHIILKKEGGEALEKEKQLEIKKIKIERDILGVKSRIELIEKEIEAKVKAKEEVEHLGELINWFENGFIKLTATMEKQIMLKVHHEFNELFMSWFNILMEDETINVRLDDSFNPVVEQNGYEISIIYLSGGEKTAAALAYRLALNKVINDLIGGIKTKDLIILDEPTDGFSSEQLDKVREVLEQIGVKQTIIVSHESKIESFVDNVIRINKNEHISEVVQ
jgi:exonuclease SbcC